MGKTLALITPGRAPRPDLVGEFLPLVGVDADVLEVGMLDGLDDAAIQQLAPRGGRHAVIAVQPDGSPVLMDPEMVARRLAERVHYVEARGADLTVVCSTLETAPVSSRNLVIYPSRLVPQTIEGLVPQGLVSVAVPLHRQRRAARRRWKALEGRLALTVYHPFDEGSVTELAGHCRETGAAMVVLDSFAYTAEHCRSVASATRLPVLSARRLVARIVAELLTRTSY